MGGGDVENLVTGWRLQERKNNKVMLLIEAKDTGCGQKLWEQKLNTSF